MIQLLTLPRINDPRGNLTFVEQLNHVPFEIKRVYWIYDVPGGEERGGHAYKQQKEFIIALSGSFDILVDTGVKQEYFSLNRSYYGLYVPSLVWRQLKNFSTNSLGVVLCSTNYDENDYIRSYPEYLRLCTQNEE